MQCARPASFAPGRGNPAGPGQGVGRTPRRSRHRVPTMGGGGGFEWAARSGWRLRLAGLAGAVRGWDLSAEVPIRKLYREVERFGKGKTQPCPPPPVRVSHETRRICARRRVLCAAPPFQVCCWEAGGQQPVALG